MIHSQDGATSTWIKATASASAGQCVEMRRRDGVVDVRDSKHPRRSRAAPLRDRVRGMAGRCQEGQVRPPGLTAGGAPLTRGAPGGRRGAPARRAPPGDPRHPLTTSATRVADRFIPASVKRSDLLEDPLSPASGSSQHASSSRRPPRRRLRRRSSGPRGLQFRRRGRHRGRRRTGRRCPHRGHRRRAGPARPAQDHRVLLVPGARERLRHARGARRRPEDAAGAGRELDDEPGPAVVDVHPPRGRDVPRRPAVRRRRTSSTASTASSTASCRPPTGSSP